MQRPFAQPLAFTELQLGQFGGLVLARGVDIDGTLADFKCSAIAPSTSFMNRTT